MAIIIEGVTACSICGEILQPNDDMVMFPHFIQDDRHPLWRFSDSGMHRACFVGWEYGAAFRAAYDQFWPKLVPHHPRDILADGTIVELPKHS